jgi:hypothetical protein
MSDYEITWDDSKIIPTLKQEICEKLGEKTWALLIDGIDVPHHEIEQTLGCRNMRVIIERLEKMADLNTIKSILMRVRHGFEHKPLNGVSKDFIECGCNLDVYLKRSEESLKEELLRHNAEGTQYWGDFITDEVLDYFMNTEGLLAPVRKGSELHIARYPYDMNSYFKETDERRKRFHYCHCLFARTSILSDEGTVSKTMCYCSLGLIISSWEETLGVRLDGEIAQSVLSGDKICKFIIYLPDDVMEKYT